LFFVLTAAIALFTSRWWRTAPALNAPAPDRSGLNRLFLITTVTIFAQLLLGATMRHQHAGLAIPDFPLAYGKVWPATDAGSVELYNQRRIEATAINPITAFQILLQMVHRLVALLILGGVSYTAWLTRRDLGSKNPLSKLTVGWLVLILAQAFLGAATIWSDKAADVATAHVLLGALSLASGVLISLTASKAITLNRAVEKVGRGVPTAPLTDAADGVALA